MGDGPRKVEPPAGADALLRRVLPEGSKGVTILGDLHEEFNDVSRARGVRSARVWYWRTALALAVRYGLDRVVAGGWRWGRGRTSTVGSLASDVRMGARMLAKTPGLSAMAVLTMAVGIGAATHAFSLLTGTVLKLLPVDGADRMVVVANAYQAGRIRPLTQQEYVDLTSLGLPLEEPAAFEERPVTLAGADGAVERFDGALMGASAFDVVGVEPFMGRFLDPMEIRGDVGRSRQMVISYDVWRTRFAADPEVIGRVVRADGASAEIVGVMPEGFGFPVQADVWLPLDLAATVDERRARFVSVFGRIPEGVDLDAAQRALESAARGLGETHPDRYDDVRLTTLPYTHVHIAGEWFTGSFAVFVASLGVLLVACANTANLLLARSSIRSGEVAIRMTLGAGRGRIVRQLLVETLVLAAGGTVLGLGLTAVGVPMVEGKLASAPGDGPYWIGASLDGAVLLFATATMIVTSLLAGIYPAVKATRPSLDEVLRDGSGGSSLRMGRVGRWLVVGQIAVSCGLLIVAGLSIKSLTKVQSLDLGFQADRVLTATVAASGSGGGSAESSAASTAESSLAGEPMDRSVAEGRAGFYRRLRMRVEELASVQAAALSSTPPGLAGERWSVTVDGVAYERPEDHPLVNGIVVTDGFFETIALPVVLGRDVAPREVWNPDEAAAVVSRSFVRLALDGRPPLGSLFKVGQEGEGFRYARIVGVVPDTYAASDLGSLGSSRRNPAQVFVTPASFASAAEDAAAPPEMVLLIRPVAGHDAVLDEAQSVISDIARDAPLFGETRLAEALAAATWPFDLLASMFTAVGLLALFLAAAGLYGVVAFSVNQSRQELGIRIALGADAARIRRLVLGRAGVQMAGGLSLGLLVGYALARPVASVTVGVDADDPAVYAVIAATLLFTGFVAAIFPARAATCADPVEAMRE